MNRPNETIIEKVLHHRGTTVQGKEVAAWLSTPEGMDYLTKRMEKDVEEPSFPLLSPSEIPSDAMYRRLLGVVCRSRHSRRRWWVAAVLIPWVMIAAALFYLDSRVPLFSGAIDREVTAPDDESLSFYFQDGSKVRLNAGSTLRFPHRFGLTSRSVSLEGEAFFEVDSHSGRPFVVETSGLKIAVKGTSFLVDAYTGTPQVTVRLYTGKVELRYGEKADCLHPNEQATYTVSSGKMKIERFDSEEKSPVWVSKRLKFYNTPLRGVLQTLSEAYHVRFNVKDSSICSLQYTLSEQKTSLESVLNDLEKISPVKFHQYADRIDVCASR